MDRANAAKKKRIHSLLRTVILLVACFVATLLILRMELSKRGEAAAVESLSAFAQRGSSGVTGKVENVASRLHTAAQLLGTGGLSSERAAQEILDAVLDSVPFSQLGLRLPDGSALLSDGTRQTETSWASARQCQGESGSFWMSGAQQTGPDGDWVVKLYVEIPDSDRLLFGTLRLEDLLSADTFQALMEKEQGIVVFESETGTILLDTFRDQEALGENLYSQDMLTQEQIDNLQAGQQRSDTAVNSWEEEGGQVLYFCVQNTGVAGWGLLAAAREDAVSRTVGMIPRSVAYFLLALLYGLAGTMVLFYQTVRERSVRDKLDQEVARSNTLMNVALPSSDVQLFELLPNGLLRLLSPGKGQVRADLFTPKQMLIRLNCSVQWEAALQAALEQAAQGQDSEVEFQTMDEEETWIQLRIDPLPGNEEVEAIGTIRGVTEEVQERHRKEDAAKLLNRMMEGTVAGLEISLEEDTWRMLWGWESYGHLTYREGSQPPHESLPYQEGNLPSYDIFVHQRVAPTIHPKDREEYLRVMERSALLGSFFTGTTKFTLEYRVRADQAPGYEWHSSEFYLFRDSGTHRIKCNLLIRQVTEAKQQELEEKRRLEEKEHILFLQAKKLVESEDELDFVHVIADYYQGIYIVDMNQDQTRSIKVPRYFADLLERENNRLSRTLWRYGQELMDPDYVPAFQALVEYDNMRKILADKGQAEMTYRKQNGTWICMRVLPMPGYSEETPKTLWIFEDETATVTLREEEEKARVTAEAAEAASQAKSQFLANMSHDIRTPLNAILGMSELGLREENAEEKDNCFRDIRGSGRILLENINSILDLSKIEAGKMEITQESYHILSTLHDAITVLRMRAQEKKLEFVAQVDENIPATLFGDDVNISHIIMNLGSNAVKYTNQGSVTMTVTWEPAVEDGALVIHMEDTGVGIRKEDMPYIFRSYGRLDRGANRHIEGTGLGLPICKKLAELMDGKLGVESTYGVGSDFWVRLPQKVVDPTPCGPYRGDIRPESDQYYNSFTAPEAAVLVVDDQALNLKVCQGLLRPYEMEVYTARSGQEALRQMTQVWPDLVFMDHMMPDMDGVEATQRIREMGKKDPYFAVVPIIALTANAMKGMKEYFLENGFNDFVSKPIELDALDQALRTWVPEDKQKAPARPMGNRNRDQAPPDLAELKGVDVVQGISFCGTAEIYRKTLVMFRDQVHGKVRRISQALEENRMEDYAIEVHSLKSGARWIGAMDLGDRAERLEMAARAGNRNQVEEDTPARLNQYQALGEALSGLTEI